MNNLPAFRTWCQLYSDSKTAVGDLARDVLADDDWPEDAETLAECREYLEGCDAIPEALAALDEAWSLYGGEIGPVSAAVAWVRQAERRSAAVKAVGCPDCGSGPGEPCDIPDLPPAAGTWSVVHRARDRATGLGPRVHRAPC